MAASLAATEQARRLDPRIRTSGAHTYFMLGEYERVLDFQPETHSVHAESGTGDARPDRRGARGPQARSTRVAPAGSVSSPRACDSSSTATRDGGARAPPTAERHPGSGRSLVRRAHDWRTSARTTKRWRCLVAVVEQGFFCLPAFTRDPWLDPLRGTPEFTAIVRRAESRHRQALISFLNAEGDRILGVAHPV